VISEKLVHQGGLRLPARHAARVEVAGARHDPSDLGTAAVVMSIHSLLTHPPIGALPARVWSREPT
jgi:hypothetical protein